MSIPNLVIRLQAVERFCRASRIAFPSPEIWIKDIEEVKAEAVAESHQVIERLYWFLRMINDGGPDGGELDAAIEQDAVMASRWAEEHIESLKQFRGTAGGKETDW